MSWSITNLEKGFDLQTAIHESSYIRQYIDANRRYFPGDGAPFAVYCGMYSQALYSFKPNGISPIIIIPLVRSI